ncbi:hypothetical protein DPEC_G00362460 [Dallia pectoralis]|nr:hypothetical protein DPEC_G00362460 [Dallia pectoralis]
MDPPVPRRLAVGGGAFVHFEKTLSVFSDLAFRERDIRGLTVDSDCIYTADGLSLYSLVASWKTDVCLIFDEGRREEIVRTLCALAMGGRELGEEFKLKCVLPDTTSRRKIVSAAPRVHSGLAGLVLSGGERVMRQCLEDELLRIRQVLAREGSKEDTNEETSNGSQGSSEGAAEDNDDGDDEVESQDSGEEYRDSGEDDVKGDTDKESDDPSEERDREDENEYTRKDDDEKSEAPSEERGDNAENDYARDDDGEKSKDLGQGKGLHEDDMCNEDRVIANIASVIRPEEEEDL